MTYLLFADLPAEQATTRAKAEKPKSEHHFFGKSFFANAPTEKTIFGLKNLITE